MCDICPSESVIVIYLVGGIVLFSIVFFLMSKKIFLSLVILSLLTNGIFLVAIFLRSPIFQIYHVQWLQYFSLFIWPIFNIFLLIRYVWKKKR